jgi:hypothetical protein
MLKILSKLFFIWYVVMIFVFMWAMFTDKRFRPFLWIWLILFGLYLYYDNFIYQPSIYIRE